MVTASMGSVIRRESIAPSDVRFVSTSGNTNDFESRYYSSQMEEIKKNYSTQNTLLAKKNSELQVRITNLEKHLFESQKQILNLKNEKILLMEKLRFNSKRYNNLIIDSFERMMTEYRSFMSDLGNNLESEKIPQELAEKMEAQEKQLKAMDLDHYWENINSDLQRRKSIIGTPSLRNMDKNMSHDCILELEEEQGEEDQLDTLVEREIIPLEPEYEDVPSSFIPIKRQSLHFGKISCDEKDANMDVIPALNFGESKNEENLHVEVCGDENNQRSDMDTRVDELFDAIETANDNRETPFISEDDSVGNKNTSTEGSSGHSDEQQVNKPSKAKKKTTKVPRELKNLDTEKTKKWLGMDPLDDVEESMSERRKSRRKSLIVNYELPTPKQNFRTASLQSKRKTKVYVDEQKENRVSKPKGSKNRNVLRNLGTNMQQRKSKLIDSDESDEADSKDQNKSIFDIENMDIFAAYDKNQKSLRSQSRESRYDLLL